MSVCKECIHYEICDPYVAPDESFPEVEGGCKCFKPTTENEYQKGYEQGVKDLTERLKKYYNNLNGTTSSGLVAYHIDQIRKEMLEKAQNCD